jgi:P4 family phage/plasmid primase-like protien
MRDLVRGVLVALDEQFSNSSANAKIDTSVFNASRITRLPGTRNKKGQDLPDRPHRASKIVAAPPAGLRLVTLEQLEDVAGEYKRYDDVDLLEVDMEAIPLASDYDVERAWKYLQIMPDAISGQRGGDSTYAACYRCAEFGLNAEQAAEVMGRFNAEKTGGEPWSGADLSRMVKRAYAYAKTKGALGVKKSVDITINQEEVVGESVGQEAAKPPGDGCGGDGKDKGHGGKRNGAGRPKKQPDLRFTDTGNASRFVKQHRGVAQYVAPWKSWVIWDGQKWNRNLKGGVSTLVEKTVASIDGEANLTTNRTERDQIKEWASQSNFLARMQAMEQISRGRLPAMPEDFNRHPWLLNVENGTLDLKTQTLRPHGPADLLTTVSPVTYNPEAQCPHWMSLLKLAFRDKYETVAYLQRLVGYAIVGDVQEHILPILWGGGNNGKSTFVTTILEILGPDLAVQGEKDMMIAFKGDRNSTGLARLWGKRFVAANESGEYGHLDETIVKIATGGDRITARHLYQDLIEFPPTHTIFLVTNHRPVTSGTDRGLWRRLAMIGFEHEIPADVVDTDIRAKLRSEYPGILNWILHGTVEWMKKGLAMPHDVRVTTEEYKKEMDTLGQFIDDRCIVADNAKCLAGRLYDSYRHWAKHCGLSVMPINIFGRKLTDRGFPGRKWKHDRYRYGIAPLEDILWNDEQTGEWQRDLWKE